MALILRREPAQRREQTSSKAALHRDRRDNAGIEFQSRTFDWHETPVAPGTVGAKLAQLIRPAEDISAR
jgi:hypothetical protein